MSGKILEVHRINQPSNKTDIQKEKCKELRKEIDERLQQFKFIDNELNSVIVYIVYNYEKFNSIEQEASVTCYNAISYKPSKKQDEGDSYFASILDNKLKKYLKDGCIEGIKVKLCVFFGFEDSDYIKNKYFAANSGKNKRVLNIVPTEPRYKLNQVILNEYTFGEIEKVLVMLKNIDKIYNEWGFSAIDPIPRSIVNFFGAPGTGKTMCAHAIASELGRKILALNYADIESKFVGDAPKNLMAAFEIASQENSVLFFDEADSFLGKRITNVSASSDQAVNSLRSQLLILLEGFEGVVIFATNLHENYDSAFLSRILTHIEFKLPDKDVRAKLIDKMIPKKAPIDKSIFTYEYLSKLSEIIDGFAPREIKNAVLDVLISSIQDGEREITKEYIEKRFKISKEKFEAVKVSNKKNPELAKKIKSNLESGNFAKGSNQNNSDSNS